MQDHIYIYLAGTIKKSNEDTESCWLSEHLEILQSLVSNAKIVFLNPALRSDDLQDQTSVFGRDLFQVFSSHIVLVDAREKRGIGVGSEMMFAKMNRIPVVTWLPLDSHYHRKEIHLLGQDVKNWIHPFIYNLSDFLAPTLESAAVWISSFVKKEIKEIKGIEQITHAIEYYLSNQLSQDEVMDQLVKTHPHFLNTFQEEDLYLSRRKTRSFMGAM